MGGLGEFPKCLDGKADNYQQALCVSIGQASGKRGVHLSQPVGSSGGCVFGAMYGKMGNFSAKYRGSV